MSELLPSTPDVSTASDETSPRVIGVDNEEADEVLQALRSETAREVLEALHEEPGAPSEVAERVDTTLQNAQYHLERLAEAGVIEVVGTGYSAKGREMDVYAPADSPLVVVAGGDEGTTGIQQALAQLLGAVGLLAVASLLIDILLDGPTADWLGGTGSAGDSQSAEMATAVETASTTGPTLFETLASSPGVAFFLGGTLILLLTVGYLQYSG